MLRKFLWEKNQLIIFMAFYIFYENSVKIFLNWFINNCYKSIVIEMSSTHIWCNSCKVIHFLHHKFL